MVHTKFVACLLCLLCTASVCAGSLSPYTQALRERFEASFHSKCNKYPFLKQWEHKLEHTDERFMTFMYHEPGLRNGGLGDRIAGLLNAVGIALRTNRTLLIESSNDFHELFQPYHSQLLQKGGAKTWAKHYTWKKENWTDWSNYSRKYTNSDDTEYDLYFCVNCVAWRNKPCAMDDGDVPQQHIKLRGNRVYFCKWATHPHLVAHKEFLKVIAPEGVKSFEQINLMEAAGCMMRLAMWPTEALWQSVSDSLATHMTPQMSSTRNKLQVGAHFRCGDTTYGRKDQDLLCVHDEAHMHGESSYMGAGNPIQIGNCVKELVGNYSNGFVEANPSEAIVQAMRLPQQRPAKERKRRLRALERSDSHIHTPSQRRWLGAATSAINKQEDVSLYIASDNSASAQQINSTANLPMSVVSPKGCHVEFDPSFDCSKLTISYWLVLAASDVIVTQTDHTGSPISAFSRYAAVYGLKGDSLRDSRDCSNIRAFYNISRRWTGNWFCD